MPDTKDYRVWAHKNQTKSLRLMGELLGVAGSAKITPGFTLTKSFGIPLKVTYDSTAGTDSNGLFFQSFNTSTSTNAVLVSQSPSNVPQVVIRVWYYDA